MYKLDALALITYNYWATDRILRAAEKITPDQFTAPVTPNPGWGSLRGTLVHTLDTELGWRFRMQLGNRSPDLLENCFPDVASVASRWDEERGAWLDYIASLDDTKLKNVYTYQGGDGTTRRRLVWPTIVHVVNHGTQHRSEAATMLTGYDSSPGDLDFGLFVHEHPEFVGE